MTHYVLTGTVRDRAARQASRYDRKNEAVSARRYGLSARTIHNRLQKKKTISSVRTALNRPDNDETSQACLCATGLTPFHLAVCRLE